MRWLVDASRLEKTLLVALLLSVCFFLYLVMPSKNWPVDKREKQLLDQPVQICVVDKSGKDHCEPEHKSPVIDGYDLKHQPAP